MTRTIAELDVNRHIKYLLLTIGVLPPQVQSQDSNKLLLVYCSVAGLLLLKYEFPPKLKQELIDFVYLHLVPTKEGFRGSLSHSIPSLEAKGQRYDPATLPNTYSALCILLMLEDDYLSKLDREVIMSYVSKCQLPDGSFLSLLDINQEAFGDGDLRQCYLATCIRKLLQYDNGPNDIDLEKLEEHTRSKIQYDGGLGSFESHAGLTFCGLAALSNIKKLDPKESIWTKTIDWLIHRQIFYDKFNEGLLKNENSDISDQGGHNGRDNKFADTCYSFWCSGSLAILGHSQYINEEYCYDYLLKQTQNNVLGGFSKTDDDHPDPYHTFLGLAALSVLKYEGIEEVDPLLVIPSRFAKKLNP